jgi:hypothetical protein
MKRLIEPNRRRIFLKFTTFDTNKPFKIMLLCLQISRWEEIPEHVIKYYTFKANIMEITQ